LMIHIRTKINEGLMGVVGKAPFGLLAVFIGFSFANIAMAKVSVDEAAKETLKKTFRF